MNKLTLPHSRYFSRLFSIIICLTSALFVYLPSPAKANSWSEFYYVFSAEFIPQYNIRGFYDAYNNYQDVINKSNNHSESSRQTQQAAQQAAKAGWMAVSHLYNATANKEYGYEEFQGVVMDFFRKIYTKVPSVYTSTRSLQIPDGSGGTKTITTTQQHNDPNPRYLFGSTLGSIPINSDCSVDIGINSPTNELGLALRYQTLAIIYTAITKNYFSPAIESMEEATRILQGEKQTAAGTPEAQVFESAVLPYLEMVMQDPFCKTNAEFARGIICVAIKKGIIPEGSSNVNCDEEFDLTQSLGCTPPQ